MTPRQAREFAERWADGWNNRDLEAVLAYFADDAVFSSPVALDLTGTGTVAGKDALRAYWGRALDRHYSLRFAVCKTLCDKTCSELAIVYDREINGRKGRGVEVLTFGPDGMIVRGEAFYGEGATAAVDVENAPSASTNP